MKQLLPNPALITSAVLLAMMPMQSQAGRYSDHYDWARVTQVEPIYSQVRTRVPRQHCWQEEPRLRYNRHHNASYTDEVLGAVIGGALGNALGKNSNSKNRRIKTVIGAAIGATVGHDIGQHNYDRQPYRTSHRTQRHCTARHDVEYHDEIVGYRVSYRYNGRHYSTRLPHHPGKRIKVQVNVEPAYQAERF